MTFLVLEDVSLRLWRGARSVQVLDDVSLHLDAGRLGGVWADRSAGKTTLTRVIAGASRIDTGRVVLDGRVIADATKRDQRIRVDPAIGLANREAPAMPDLAVEQWIAQTMIASCSWSQALRQASVALDRVGAGQLGGEPWTHLADSERTLVAIAYAIARGPRLLLVDDLVSGLGAWRRQSVLALLHEIAGEGVTVLMTSSDVADLKGADRIWSLEAGRLIEAAAGRSADVLPLRSAGSRTP
jgi:ABC-type sulfate/molybdate transport systems ATPase subunit